MSDNKNPFSEALGSIVTGIKDEVGQSIEAGVTSITGQTSSKSTVGDDIDSTETDPSKLDQTKLDEQKKLAESKFFLERQAQIEAEVARARAQREEMERQRLEVQVKESQDKAQKTQAKNANDIALVRAQTKTEMKYGAG